jgi:hypothetical protein
MKYIQGSYFSNTKVNDAMQVIIANTVSIYNRMFKFSAQVLSLTLDA